jgi:hypothetical protein
VDWRRPAPLSLLSYMGHNMISKTNFLGQESRGSSFQLSIPVKTILFFTPSCSPSYWTQPCSLLDMASFFCITHFKNIHKLSSTLDQNLNTNNEGSSSVSLSLHANAAVVPSNISRQFPSSSFLNHPHSPYQSTSKRCYESTSSVELQYSVLYFVDDKNTVACRPVAK